MKMIAWAHEDESGHVAAGEFLAAQKTGNARWARSTAAIENDPTRK